MNAVHLEIELTTFFSLAEYFFTFAFIRSHQHPYSHSLTSGGCAVFGDKRPKTFFAKERFISQKKNAGKKIVAKMHLQFWRHN